MSANTRPAVLSDDALDALRSLPEYMRAGVVRYIEDGTPPGGFFRAVFANDLMGACEKADRTNRRRLFDYCQWIYNHAPAGSWGSREAIREWCATRRAVSAEAT